MPQSYTALYHHIIFSTKDRKPYITPAIQSRLYEYMRGLCKHRNSHCKSIGGVADHVHMLVDLNKEESLSGFMREIKATSSKWVGETFPDQPFAWQSGYSAFSVSQSVVSAVVQYIETQEEHHQKRSFQDELLDFLHKHGIEPGPYIWK